MFALVGETLLTGGCRRCNQPVVPDPPPFRRSRRLTSFTLRVVAGLWLGPWALCHALQAAVREYQEQEQQEQQHEGQQHQQRQRQRTQQRLTVHLVCSPGGGAPSLQPSVLHRLFETSSFSSSGGPSPGSAGAGMGGSTAGGAVVATEAAAGRSWEACAGASGCSGGGCGGSSAPQKGPALLLLIPVTLGVGMVGVRMMIETANRHHPICRAGMCVPARKARLGPGWQFCVCSARQTQPKGGSKQHSRTLFRPQPRPSPTPPVRWTSAT